MSIYFNKKILFTIMRSCLHIAVYIALGLLLAFLINGKVYAAELNELDNPLYINEETAIESMTLEENPDTGWLLITSFVDNTGYSHRLAGVFFEVRSTFGDALITLVLTDNFGEAGLELPVGDYYVREVSVPVGFQLNPSRVYFTVSDGRFTEIVTQSVPIPEPLIQPEQEQPAPQGRLIITNKAHGTGYVLQGAVFDVRRAIDDVFTAQITANQFGEASVMLIQGSRDNRGKPGE